MATSFNTAFDYIIVEKTEMEAPTSSLIITSTETSTALYRVVSADGDPDLVGKVIASAMGDAVTFSISGNTYHGIKPKHIVAIIEA